MQHLLLRAANAPALLKQFRTATLLAFTVCAVATILVSGLGGHLLMPVKAATLTVCPSGCSATTINGAIALANPGDFIRVVAGTYNELVIVNKDNLILWGPNFDINPCAAARSPEAIVGTPNGAFQITGRNVYLEGFQIQGVTGGLGAGVHAVGANLAHIGRNIIQNNVIGILLGGDLQVLDSNLICHNNNPGPGSGTGIYSDTGLTNADLSRNCFRGHTRAALNIIGAPVVAAAVNKVYVYNNAATNDAAFSFIGGSNLLIEANRSSGSSLDAMRFRGGVNGATVINNQLTNGAAGGISVRNDLGGPNTNIPINCNRLVGFDKTAAIVVDPNANIGLLNPLATAAIIVDQGAYMGTLNAEGNFFGCNAGPNNAGCGTVTAFDNNLDFTPWSTLALMSLGDPNLVGRSARYSALLSGSPVMCGLETLPITFTATCGTPTPPTRPFPGEVWTTLTSSTVGACSISATLDNQTVTLNQTISNLPMVTIGTPAGCIGPGTTVPVTFTMSNPGTTPVTLSGEWNHAPGLRPLSNTCTANLLINCQPLGSSRLQFSGVVVPGGQTAIITYQAQVGDVLPNTSLCVDTTFSINQSVAIPVAQACFTGNCAPAVPGALFSSSAEVSGQKSGSVLVYNLFSSSGSAPNTQNTRISMTNTHATQPVAVHLFFVDSASCSVADAFICLSQNQTASFLMSDFDPGTTGYIVAIASDAITGCPINFNYLIGDEFIKLTSGHAANLPAEAIAALPGGLPACNDNSVTAQLNFNGVSYNRLPRVLADSNLPSRADGNDTLLVINRIGGNLATGAATIGTLFGLIYDDAESGFSFSLSGGCQLRGSFGAPGFPRTVPPVSTIIPAGRTGWLKVYHQTEDLALLGAAINFNANAGTQSGAFNQGHNLHKLSLSSAATLTIPVFPPRC